MKNPEKKLISYKPAYVNDYIDKLTEQYNKTVAAFKAEIEKHKHDKIELNLEIQRLNDKEELIAKTIYDTTSRIKQLEEETARRCEESEARITALRNELIEAALAHKGNLYDEGVSSIDALSGYIDELGEIGSKIKNIEVAFGVSKPEFKLEDLNATPDLEEVCKELGLMPVDESANNDNQ